MGRKELVNNKTKKNLLVANFHARRLTCVHLPAGSRIFSTSLYFNSSLFIVKMVSYSVQMTSCKVLKVFIRKTVTNVRFFGVLLSVSLRAQLSLHKRSNNFSLSIYTIYSATCYTYTYTYIYIYAHIMNDWWVAIIRSVISHVGTRFNLRYFALPTRSLTNFYPLEIHYRYLGSVNQNTQ